MIQDVTLKPLCRFPQISLSIIPLNLANEDPAADILTVAPRWWVAFAPTPIEPPEPLLFLLPCQDIFQLCGPSTNKYSHKNVLFSPLV